MTSDAKAIAPAAAAADADELLTAWRSAIGRLAVASDADRRRLNRWLATAAIDARLSCHAHTYALDVRTATAEQHIEFLAKRGVRAAVTGSKALRVRLDKALGGGGGGQNCRGPQAFARLLGDRHTLRARNAYVQHSDDVRWATATGVAEWGADDWADAPPKPAERRAMLVRHLSALLRTRDHETTTAAADEKRSTASPQAPSPWPVWYRTTNDPTMWQCTDRVASTTTTVLPEWVRAAPAFRLLEKRGQLVRETDATAVDRRPLAVYLLIARDVCAPAMFATQSYVGVARKGIAARWTTQRHSHRRGIEAVLGATGDTIAAVSRDVQLVDCVVAATLLAAAAAPSPSTPFFLFHVASAFDSVDAMCAEELVWRASPEASLRDARFGLNVV